MYARPQRRLKVVTVTELPRPHINLSQNFLKQLKLEAQKRGQPLADYLGELVVLGHREKE